MGNESGRRKEFTFEAIERAKEQRRFDDKVARGWADGLSVRAIASELCGGRTPKKVEASLAWQGIRAAEGEAVALSAELLHEINLERSLRSRQFDGDVLRHSAAGRSPAEIALILDQPVPLVELSLAHLQLSTGRGTYRQGRVTGRLSSRPAIARLLTQLLSASVKESDSAEGC